MRKSKQTQKPTLSNIGNTYELNSIKNGFIKPLLKFMMQAVDRHQLAGAAATEHTSTPLKEMLETIFGTKYRDIVPCYTTKAFKMPGLLWGTAGRADADAPSLEASKVQLKAPCFVRIDERTPNVIDVEVMGSWNGRESRMFTLTNLEYRSIRPFLKELEGCPKQALEAPDYSR